MKKLHIGCGKTYLPGWTNVDIFSSVKADTYADMSALPFDRESFDIIYACHVLEHAHRHMVVAVLTHWHDLLKKGGILRLAVPNFEAVVEWYTKTGNLDDVMGLLYGGQGYHLNRHTVTFDHKTLNRDLTRAGFWIVRQWNWKDTDHAKYDDYSQAFLPHLNKSGLLMSLNMEAIK